VHLNYNYSSDGISVGDEDMLQKSMKRTAWKNLDGPAPQQASSSDGKSNSTRTLDALPSDMWVSRLQGLGFLLGKTKQETTPAIKALKRIDIDRTRVEAKRRDLNKPNGSDSNPFELSDDEDTRSDSALLAHLVGDISEVCFDDEELDTKICDLMATSKAKY
jgi:hypothetical protein